MVLASTSFQDGIVEGREGITSHLEPSREVDNLDYDYLFAIDPLIRDSENMVRVLVNACLENTHGSPICEDGDIPLVGVPIEVAYVCKTDEGAFQTMINPVSVDGKVIRQELYTDSAGVLTMPEFGDEECLNGRLDQVLVSPLSERGRLSTGEKIVTSGKSVLAERESLTPNGVQQEWHIKFSIRNPEL